MTQPPCGCGEKGRDLLTTLGFDPDVHTTPPLVGSGQDSLGECEHGVTWYARPRPRAATPARSSA